MMALVYQALVASRALRAAILAWVIIAALFCLRYLTLPWTSAIEVRHFNNHRSVTPKSRMLGKIFVLYKPPDSLLELDLLSYANSRLAALKVRRDLSVNVYSGSDNGGIWKESHLIISQLPGWFASNGLSVDRPGAQVEIAELVAFIDSVAAGVEFDKALEVLKNYQIERVDMCGTKSGLTPAEGMIWALALFAVSAWVLAERSTKRA